MIDVVEKSWPIFVSLVVFVAWLIRLESKVLYLERDQQQHKELYGSREITIWAKIDAIQSTMTSILQSLAKIEGKLENKD